MSANDRQIDGDHYVAKYQHWDWAERNGLGYIESVVSKYVTRHRKKHENGRVDVEKAYHYVEKLKELFEEGVRLPRSCCRIEEIVRYARANDLTPTEAEVCTYMGRWSDSLDLQATLDAIQCLIEEYSDNIGYKT